MGFIKDYLLGIPPEEAIDRMKVQLLKGKTWRYLRYLHARNALTYTEGWKDILVIGAGNGFAEIALALEYPDRHFYLSDYENATHSTRHARALVKRFKMKNISFIDLNILDKPTKRFDVVYSVEVLEHIKDDKLAVQNMLLTARKYIFCLVPFATPEDNQNTSFRQRVWEKHEHYVVGYNAEELSQFFSNIIKIQGCYWADAGVGFRKQLTSMSLKEIDQNIPKLLDDADRDVKESIPKTLKDALGIWVLSKV